MQLSSEAISWEPHTQHGRQLATSTSQVRRDIEVTASEQYKGRGNSGEVSKERGRRRYAPKIDNGTDSCGPYAPEGSNGTASGLHSAQCNGTAVRNPHVHHGLKRAAVGLQAQQSRTAMTAESHSQPCSASTPGELQARASGRAATGKLHVQLSSEAISWERYTQQSRQLATGLVRARRGIEVTEGARYTRQGNGGEISRERSNPQYAQQSDGSADASGLYAQQSCNNATSGRHAPSSGGIAARKPRAHQGRHSNRRNGRRYSRSRRSSISCIHLRTVEVSGCSKGAAGGRPRPQSGGVEAGLEMLEVSNGSVEGMHAKPNNDAAAGGPYTPKSSKAVTGGWLAKKGSRGVVGGPQARLDSRAAAHELGRQLSSRAATRESQACKRSTDAADGWYPQEGDSATACRWYAREGRRDAAGGMFPHEGSRAAAYGSPVQQSCKGVATSRYTVYRNRAAAGGLQARRSSKAAEGGLEGVVDRRCVQPGDSAATGKQHKAMSGGKTAGERRVPKRDKGMAGKQPSEHNTAPERPTASCRWSHGATMTHRMPKGITVLYYYSDRVKENLVEMLAREESCMLVRGSDKEVELLVNLLNGHCSLNAAAKAGRYPPEPGQRSETLRRVGAERASAKGQLSLKVMRSLWRRLKEASSMPGRRTEDFYLDLRGVSESRMVQVTGEEPPSEEWTDMAALIQRVGLPRRFGVTPLPLAGWQGYLTGYDWLGVTHTLRCSPNCRCAEKGKMCHLARALEKRRVKR